MSDVGSIGGGSSAASIAAFEQQLLLEEQAELNAQLAAQQQAQVGGTNSTPDNTSGSNTFSASTSN
jgi:hypothetical protein